MADTPEELERGSICRVCTDRNNEGECGREDPNSCALFRLFPYVVKAVHSVQSDDIRDYVSAIRRDVCSVCMQDADGACPERAQVRCSLDAYLILVVGAIEEATGKTFDRTVLEPAVR
jgi:hypothetical protein